MNKMTRSRGCHRLGLFLALGAPTVLLCYAVVADLRRDQLAAIYIAALALLIFVYPLTRLAGWTINGFKPD